MTTATANPLRLVAGRNCWRLETARRVGLCVDGECYFAMLRQSFIAARRCIAIAAWDLHSRLELVRPDPHDGWPTALGDMLLRLLEDRPQLEIFILLWDYAPIYALEREPLFFGEVPWHKDANRRHPRLHFILDDAHPMLASQHQKLALIDGDLAWCGGFDISKWRWDTEAHAAHEPRRCDPDGDPYPPFHDVQMLVDGDAATALCELFAERWERAGGGRPQLLQTRVAARSAAHEPVANGAEPDVDAWPAQLGVFLREQAIGIARTLPAFAGHAEARESEQLYLDMIASAKELIYIENQYLTSRSVAAALKHCLAQPQGPRILMILPRETGHWLEQHTMDLIRGRILNELRDADRHGRLSCYYPDLPALGDRCLMVHAKLMIVDDRALRVGSSNLSNRSMGLDSECDLCLVADTDEARLEIRRLRQRLLAMFGSLGAERPAAEEADAEAGNPDDSTLRLTPLKPSIDPEWDRQFPDERLIDPDRPLSSEWVGDVVVGAEHEPHARWRVLVGIGLILVFLALAVLWRWTPVGDWLEPQRLTQAAQALSRSSWGIPVALGAFVLASLAAVPVTLLILVTTLVFDPLPGALLALGGATLAAAAGYQIGHFTGARAAEKRLGGRLGDLRQRLTKRGVLAVVVLRIVPVAPFAVLNLIAGAIQVRFRDYLIGTVLGMAPAVIAMALFSEGLLQVLGRADMRSFALLLASLIIAAALLFLGRHLLRKVE